MDCLCRTRLRGPGVARNVRAGQYNEVAVYSLGCRLRSLARCGHGQLPSLRFVPATCLAHVREGELGIGQAASPQIGRPYLVPSMSTATWGKPHPSADAARPPPPPPSGMDSSHSYVTPTGTEPCCLLISGR
eukprot:COSAG02_NODE_13339_length_1407_cov_1.630734_2_plen_132_part_00